MNILIIKPSSLGDIIHALPFLKALKEKYPDARVDWVISRILKDIIEGNSLINELIVIDKDAWRSPTRLPQTAGEVFRTIAMLRTKRYDMIADLQGLLRSGIITYVTPADIKIGFDNAREGSRFFYNRKVKAESSLHAVKRNLGIARALGANPVKVSFPLEVSEEAVLAAKKLVHPENKYILIVPSARWRTKRWPAENFAALIKSIPITCVISGSPADSDIARKIAEESSKNTINLCGRTGLKELVALIKGARAVVSSDSGPMHIGAAIGTPVVALFGPTDAARTGPYGWQERGDLTVISSDVTCRPCFKRKCKDPVCMSGITVARVLEEARKYIT